MLLRKHVDIILSSKTHKQEKNGIPMFWVELTTMAFCILWLFFFCFCFLFFLFFCFFFLLFRSNVRILRREQLTPLFFVESIIPKISWSQYPISGTAILNIIDISRKWCKLNFGPLRRLVKSRHFPERINARRQYFYFLWKFLGIIGRKRLG